MCTVNLLMGDPTIHRKRKISYYADFELNTPLNAGIPLMV